MTIYRKIFDITHEVKSVSQTKPKGIQYKVTNWNDVNDVVREQLAKHKLLLIPKVMDHTKEGNLTTVKMNCDVIDVDTNEKMTVGDYYGYGVDNSDKGVGKATTYAYKYLIMKLFLLEVGEAEDSENENPIATKPKQEKKEHSI